MFDLTIDESFLPLLKELIKSEEELQKRQEQAEEPK